MDMVLTRETRCVGVSECLILLFLENVHVVLFPKNRDKYAGNSTGSDLLIAGILIPVFHKPSSTRPSCSVAVLSPDGNTEGSGPVPLAHAAIDETETIYI